VAIKHKHHIIPKHAGGTDDSSNIIELTIEDHALAHKNLYECYGRWQDRIAWLTLSGQIGKEDARILAIREGIKTRDQSYFKTKEWSDKISKANTGKKRTEAHKNNYRKPKSEEHKKKLAKHLLNIEWTEERKKKISDTLKQKHKCPHCDFQSNSSHISRHIKRAH
jgi:DNA-directed RNA polymerase subunit M/transcription elongation factor TFIIS